MDLETKLRSGRKKGSAHQSPPRKKSRRDEAGNSSQLQGNLF